MMPLYRKRGYASNDETVLSFKLINTSTKSGPLSAVMRYGNEYLFCNYYPNRIFTCEQVPVCIVENTFIWQISLCWIQHINACKVFNRWFPPGLPLPSCWAQECSLSRCISHLYNHGCWVWVAQLILGCCKSGAVLPRQHVQRHASFFGFFELIC